MNISLSEDVSIMIHELVRPVINSTLPVLQFKQQQHHLPGSDLHVWSLISLIQVFVHSISTHFLHPTLPHLWKDSLEGLAWMH